MLGQYIYTTQRYTWASAQEHKLESVTRAQILYENIVGPTGHIQRNELNQPKGGLKSDFSYSLSLIN